MKSDIPVAVVVLLYIAAFMWCWPIALILLLWDLFALFFNRGNNS